MNLIQFDGCTVAVIAPEDLEALEVEINALRARLAESDEQVRELKILADDNTGWATLLHEEEEKTRALRGFAEAMNSGMRGQYAQVLKSRAWIKRQMVRHGLMEEDGKPTPLLTGERGGEDG